MAIKLGKLKQKKCENKLHGSAFRKEEQKPGGNYFSPQKPYAMKRNVQWEIPLHGE